jgi:hypothetical protein
VVLRPIANPIRKLFVCVGLVAGLLWLGQPARAELESDDLTLPDPTLETLLGRACATNRLSASELDSVKAVSDRSTLFLAIRGAELEEKRRGGPEAFDPRLRYRLPSNANEAQRRIHEEYGPDSFLTRSVSTVTAIANAAERTSHRSLDGMTEATESLVNRSGEALGFDRVEVPHLRPRISGNRAGVYVSTKW